MAIPQWCTASQPMFAEAGTLLGKVQSRSTDSQPWAAEKNGFSCNQGGIPIFGRHGWFVDVEGIVDKAQH